jgi:ribonuclease P protein component
MNQKFGKEYKLCRKKVIDSVFKEGVAVKQYPFVLYFKEEMSLENVFQVTFSAPKRIFRKAHDRNRIKRLMKEPIRLNKNKFENCLLSNHLKMALFLVYVGKEEFSFQELNLKAEMLLEKVIKQLKVDENKI